MNSNINHAGYAILYHLFIRDGSVSVDESDGDGQSVVSYNKTKPKSIV